MQSTLALKGGRPVRTKPFPRWPLADAQDENRLLAVLRSGKWSFDGPLELEFAQRFAAYTGAKECLCVANGSVSLEIALRALGIGPGDEVIVPALTWIATAAAVVNVGARPVFADVNESDWCIDPNSVRERLTSRTRAVIPVHLYGQMANLDVLGALAQRHSLAIIEDCAHAHGMQWRGQGAGTVGNIGSYSFQQNKVMSAGEGGAVVTNRADLADRLYGLKNCGRKRTPQSEFSFGTNFRLTEFQAAVLLGQLERLDAQLALKNENAVRFRKALRWIPGVAALDEKPEVTRRGMYGFGLRLTPAAFAGAPLELIIEALRAEGLPVQRTYDVVYRSPLWTAGPHLVKFGPGIDSRQHLGLDADCPVAERIAREGVVILHPAFLGTAADTADLASGLAKVQAHAGEFRLAGLQKRIRKSGRELLRRVTLLS